jgi:uncharacterized protein (UPF0276 family)
VAHGLSLNLGGPAPLDEAYLQRIKQFLDDHAIRCYSEHLSYCADDGQLYDLMPIPFTADAVDYVAARHTPHAGDPRTACGHRKRVLLLRAGR